jgi:dTDP-4-dehydrorhamnose reductase
MTTPMRILVTGRDGQVARSLVEAAASAGVDVVACGRPELDLERPLDIAAVIAARKPDIVVSAAAWTAVDQAETEAARATLVNEKGAGAVAAAARAIGVPVIHLSTDYVFDGSLDRPYRETDATGPTGVYGASKLAGERAVAAANPDHAILRTSWVHATEGKNFLRTMLRLAETRDEVGVVADQVGAPTYAPDIVAGVIAVARNLLADPGRADMRGIFHMAGGGDAASWADFADAIFDGLRKRGGKRILVRRLTTAEFPTPTRRPANSRLDCSLIRAVHGVELPDWRTGVDRSLDRILMSGVRS